ncbi:Exosortase [Burkholderiales bacterium 8X]|nr:Exosortase [Burkholderiales bacterium 8X]
MSNAFFLDLSRLAATHPRLIDRGIGLDRAPAAGWLALQAAALWPTWRWMAERMQDGSDDPLGLLAIAALLAVAWTHRKSLRPSPSLGWLALAAVASVAATVATTGVGALPPAMPLAAALLAVAAMGCGLLAFLPRSVAAAPVIGLAVLALPLLSSLQFYAGYPLRVLTAEASRWLLAPAFEVTRQGHTLLVDGRLIIVDAPCSGVQMAWFGYFTACVVALWLQRSGRSFAARLPAVGMLVLTGNVLRNSLLVAFEGAGHPASPWLHDAIGLVLLALVCVGIAKAMGLGGSPREASSALTGCAAWADPARGRLPAGRGVRS